MGKDHALVDLTGKQIGNWLVLSRAENMGRNVRWLCRCTCGSGIERIVMGNSLRGGYSKGCGCILKEAMIEVRKRLNPNPHSQLNEYKLYQAAKTRAKRDGLPFDITYQDVIIPAHCPVLGIELEPCVGTHGPSDNSPSIDKIIPELGYVKGNIQVISFRANTIKRDATAEELRKVLQYVEQAA